LVYGTLFLEICIPPPPGGRGTRLCSLTIPAFSVILELGLEPSVLCLPFFDGQSSPETIDPKGDDGQ
jgi:hypothetical protein